MSPAPQSSARKCLRAVIALKLHTAPSSPPFSPHKYLGVALWSTVYQTRTDALTAHMELRVIRDSHIKKNKLHY